jgi:hypothetical protein
MRSVVVGSWLIYTDGKSCDRCPDRAKIAGFGNEIVGVRVHLSSLISLSVFSLCLNINADWSLQKL